VRRSASDAESAAGIDVFSSNKAQVSYFESNITKAP
jgi:hypothetical protein